MKDRSIRREQDKNKKAKCRRIILKRSSIFNSTTPKKDINEIDSKQVGKMAAAPQSCIMICCSHRRKLAKGNDKLTMQEIKETLKFREYLY